MATRAFIGLKQGDNIQVIYNHSDGYPEYLGKMLEQHYNSEEKVKELLSYGDVSILKPTIEDSIFYHRDRGEELQKPTAYRGLKHLALSLKKDSFIEYIYIFDNGSWTTYSPAGLQKAAYSDDVAKTESAATIKGRISKFFEPKQEEPVAEETVYETHTDEVLPTTNPHWGFWGTMMNSEHIDNNNIVDIWEQAFDVVYQNTLDIDGVDLVDIRNFLDSRFGRQFANEVLNQLLPALRIKHDSEEELDILAISDNIIEEAWNKWPKTWKKYVVDVSKNRGSF